MIDNEYQEVYRKLNEANDDWSFSHKKTLKLIKEMKLYKDYKQYSDPDCGVYNLALMVVVFLVLKQFFGMDIFLASSISFISSGVVSLMLAGVLKHYGAKKLKKQYIRDYYLADDFFETFDYKKAVEDLKQYEKESTDLQKRCDEYEKRLEEIKTKKARFSGHTGLEETTINEIGDNVKGKSKVLKRGVYNGTKA